MMLMWAFWAFSSVLLQIASSQRIRFPEERWGNPPSILSQSSPSRNICRQPGSECVFLRNCPALRGQRNWREMAQLCGYTSGRRRYRVCCETEVETFREPTVDEPRANVVQGMPECGKPILGRSNQPYVLGGDVAPEGMWPWMVAIRKKIGKELRSSPAPPFS
uniref:U7-Hypotoxin-Hsp1a_1 n=1 Tax=Hypochilus sp. SGP-2016 TaxID=1905178 RepID=A0A482ZJG2_9ARAC